MQTSLQIIQERIDNRCNSKPCGCVVGTCSKSGCRLTLKDLPKDRVFVDMDRNCYLVNNKSKRCDYLFFCCDSSRGVTWVAAIELKKGRAVASEVVPQLIAGARLATQIVSQIKGVDLYMIIAFQGIRNVERNELRKRTRKIEFGDLKPQLVLLKCGSPLKKAFGY